MFNHHGADFTDKGMQPLKYASKIIHQMNFQKKMYIYCKFFFLGMKKALRKVNILEKMRFIHNRGEYSNGKRRKREREI